MGFGDAPRSPGSGRAGRGPAGPAGRAPKASKGKGCAVLVAALLGGLLAAPALAAYAVHAFG